VPYGEIHVSSLETRPPPTLPFSITAAN
jgi:hypothetical protein